LNGFGRRQILHHNESRRRFNCPGNRVHGDGHCPDNGLSMFLGQVIEFLSQFRVTLPGKRKFLAGRNNVQASLQELNDLGCHVLKMRSRGEHNSIGFDARKKISRFFSIKILNVFGRSKISP
jgi:hypothetical protein